MENLAPSRNLFLPPRLMLPSFSDLVVEIGRSHSLNSIQNILEVLIVLRFLPTLYCDQSKSTTIFSEIFIKIIILRVKKHFWEKFCMSVLFNNYFPFSIKMPVKYNKVMLVVNKMTKSPWSHKHLKNVFLKKKTSMVKMKPLRYSHANWNSTLKILHSIYLLFFQ